jgi:hypothetical protein
MNMGEYVCNRRSIVSTGPSPQWLRGATSPRRNPCMFRIVRCPPNSTSDPTPPLGGEPCEKSSLAILRVEWNRNLDFLREAKVGMSVQQRADAKYILCTAQLQRRHFAISTHCVFFEANSDRGNSKFKAYIDLT